MLLCISIGNSDIALGLWHQEQWVAHWRIRTVREQTPDEYAMLLKGLLRDGGLELPAATRVVLASVVPPLTPVFAELARRHLAADPLVLGPGVRTGLRIRIDNPVELGAVLVTDAVAAYDRFHCACIVADFGSATTFSAISARGDLEGVAIACGLGVAAEALASRTAQLPRVSLVPPPAAIGKNTVHSMQSGLVLGYVGLVDELIRRIRRELGGEAKVIATGGLSGVVAPLTPEIDLVDPWLTLDGLRIIAERNPL
jgi:type III pantothenate kinase